MGPSRPGGYYIQPWIDLCFVDRRHYTTIQLYFGLLIWDVGDEKENVIHFFYFLKNLNA